MSKSINKHIVQGIDGAEKEMRVPGNEPGVCTTVIPS